MSREAVPKQIIKQAVCAPISKEREFKQSLHVCVSVCRHRELPRRIDARYFTVVTLGCSASSHDRFILDLTVCD